jgi:hypothetical protein
MGGAPGNPEDASRGNASGNSEDNSVGNGSENSENQSMESAFELQSFRFPDLSLNPYL